MNFVVGSGPSGVAAAQALLARGQPVTMLDGGLRLEPERLASVERLRQTDPKTWRQGMADLIREADVPDRKGIGRKRVFGSDYPYRDPGRFLPLVLEGVETGASLAAGGFSSVWGANLLPFLPSDIADWPIGVRELAPHYEAVLSWMKTAATEDDLAALFPLYTARRSPLRRSRQAEQLLRDLAIHRDRLRAEGIWFGSSRLAVRAEASAAGPGCVYCGLCMHGCPHGLIYNSDENARQLASHPLFQRRSGIIVDRFVEDGSGGVKIFGKQGEDGSPVRFEAARLYLAAGALSTARIVLRSLDAYGQTVHLRDNPYYLFPLLRYAGTSGAAEEELHTLAQAFIEIVDPAVSPKTVHLQIYTYNDLIAAAVRQELGGWGRLIEPALRPLLNRLLIVQGYLHSDHAPPLEVALERGVAGPDLLRVRASPAHPAQVAEPLERVMRKLSRNSRFLRGKPLAFLLNRTSPGRGFHSGGTFPMSDRPTGFATDLWGRPVGFGRVHLVDASVLPSLPATTITLSVMANAHRIATESYAG